MAEPRYLMAWCEAEDTWMHGHGFYEWHCFCDAQLVVVWHSTCDLYDTDETISADDALTSSWQWRIA